ncbi:hypothetical protein [Fictibacillus fluitans]|uniref:Uncharacterized protein n=1 Tax=Fictibacillus fluitans TaxID=3058422 RepID=A0ABT8HR00_9BACL|nr:hypothetical protein [Fictibacillus sp. NE201]MDN4523180.1 hypothetical protein [Fictibacillus sp. NE201]
MKKTTLENFIDKFLVATAGHKAVYKQAINLAELAKRMDVSKSLISTNTKDEVIAKKLEEYGIKKFKKGKVVYFDFEQSNHQISSRIGGL